ncbi:MAG: CAP domain-containing protein [Bacteroidota bacterium]|nr:CAP domain-containing protein [Bacteroidota bacterium]
MKSFLLLLVTCFIVRSAPPELDRQEAKKAFVLLNKIRSNPALFTEEMPFLAEIGVRPLLKWNDTLAAVAEAKALDMATRQYMSHTNPEGYGMNHYINKAGYRLNAKWLTKKEMNYFESLSAGAPDGETAIRNLIIDKNVPSLGHRKHLLGLDEWNASLYDIGIGYAKPDGNSRFRSYVCVVIAKHNW